jgi:DnaJ-class molecular chaperone
MSNPQRPDGNAVGVNLPQNEGPAGSPGNVCPLCNGAGLLSGRDCPDCGGTGKIGGG